MIFDIIITPVTFKLQELYINMLFEDNLSYV